MANKHDAESGAAVAGAAPCSAVSCPLCDGAGEITNEKHPDHPKNTHDGHDETWCLGCEGSGLLEVKRGVVMAGRYEGERLSLLKKWRKLDGPPNNLCSLKAFRAIDYCLWNRESVFVHLMRKT